MARRKKGQGDMISSISTFLLLKNIPFYFFLGFLGVIYIANAHYSEKKIREIQVLQKDIQELNWEYMSIKSDLMQQSMQSEVAKKVKNLNLKELVDRPKKIVVFKD